MVRGRKVFCKLAVKSMQFSGVSVARFLEVNTSLVNRYASSAGLGNLDQFLNVAFEPTSPPRHGIWRENKFSRPGKGWSASIRR